jgi:hypothetical protein
MSLAMTLAGISESALAKKPVPPPPPSTTPSYYFIDSSNPPKVIGKALDLSTFFSSGTALLNVSGPSGAKSLTIDINRSSLLPSGSLYFESADCSGTAYVLQPGIEGFPGLGTRNYAVIPGYDGATQTGAFLYVADASTSNTISTGSYAYSMTLGAAGYVFDCFSSASEATVFPAVFYGNLYDTYKPPFDVVVP